MATAMTTAAKKNSPTKTEQAQIFANAAFYCGMVCGLGEHGALSNATIVTGWFIKNKTGAHPNRARKQYFAERSAQGQLEDKILHLQKLIAGDFYPVWPAIKNIYQAKLEDARAELAALQQPNEGESLEVVWIHEADRERYLAEDSLPSSEHEQGCGCFMCDPEPNTEESCCQYCNAVYVVREDHAISNPFGLCPEHHLPLVDGCWIGECQTCHTWSNTLANDTCALCRLAKTLVAMEQSRAMVVDLANENEDDVCERCGKLSKVLYDVNVHTLQHDGMELWCEQCLNDDADPKHPQGCACFDCHDYDCGCAACLWQHE